MTRRCPKRRHPFSPHGQTGFTCARSKCRRSLLIRQTAAVPNVGKIEGKGIAPATLVAPDVDQRVHDIGFSGATHGARVKHAIQSARGSEATMCLIDTPASAKHAQGTGFERAFGDGAGQRNCAGFRPRSTGKSRQLIFSNACTIERSCSESPTATSNVFTARSSPVTFAIRLRNIDAERRERLRQRREHTGFVHGHDANRHRSRELRIFVPDDFDPPLEVHVQRARTSEGVHRDAAPAPSQNQRYDRPAAARSSGRSE